MNPEPDHTAMFAEAAEAPHVVSRLLAANHHTVAQLAADLRTNPPTAVLTCARGSSDHAATYLRYLIETRLGVLTSSAAPSVASIYGGSPAAAGMLCTAISQSGASPDLVATMQAAKEAGAATLAMVNVEGSPLALLADTMLPLHAGRERSVAATKSYIAALAVSAQLVAAWGEDKALAAGLASLPEQLERA